MIWVALNFLERLRSLISFGYIPSLNILSSQHVELFDGYIWFCKSNANKKYFQAPCKGCLGIDCLWFLWGNSHITLLPYSNPYLDLKMSNSFEIYCLCKSEMHKFFSSFIHGSKSDLPYHVETLYILCLKMLSNVFSLNG